MPPPAPRPLACLAPVLLAAMAMAASVAATPDPDAQPLSAAAMWKLARVGEPRLSPDGSRAVFTITRYDVEANRGYTQIVLLPTGAGAAGRLLTSGPAPSAEPAWSPDGRALVFVSRRDGEPEPQVYLLPGDGGEARRLTHLPTGAAMPRWFPDGRRISFVSRVWPDARDEPAARKRLRERAEPAMTARTWEHAPFSRGDHFLDDREAHLFVTDVDGAEPFSPTLDSGQHLDLADNDVASYDISPDGREIAFVADADTTHVRANRDVYVVAASGGPARDVTADNEADDLEPRYSPDGRWLAWLAQAKPRFYADTRQVRLLERTSGARRALAAGFDRSPEGITWSPDSRGLYAIAEDRATRRIFHFPLSGREPRPLTQAGDYAGIAIAGAPAVMVALRQSLAEPPNLVRVALHGGAATPLSGINRSPLTHVRMGTVESVTYPGAGGTPIQMWVVKPPDFDSARRYPLLLLLHGGPHNAITDQWQWHWNAQVFAAWGYVVAWHNFHGSSGFGEAFTDSITRDWAQLPYEDTIRAADWFRGQPWIDPERMVAGGASYGGYLATLLLGRPHPFKALIAHAAVFDLYTQQASDFGAQRQRFGEYWERGPEYTAQSPHLYAANFNTPTLVIHNALDMRVPVDQGLELFNVLQNRGVPSKLVMFPDEGHWVLKPQNSLYWYQTVREWLARFAPP